MTTLKVARRLVICLLVFSSLYAEAVWGPVLVSQARYVDE